MVLILIEDQVGHGETLKNKEVAIVRVGELIASQLDGQGSDFAPLAAYIRSLESKAWTTLPRAKTARLLSTLLDLFPSSVLAKATEMQLTKELVEWTIRDNRSFLKQSLELRLAGLFLTNKLYTDALALVGRMLLELKRMEDKLALVEVHLLECRIYYTVRNGPKAKAALTAARSNANSIYCPPLLQAALDMQSALLHADDGDFKTASSYFVEALDAYAAVNDPRGATALKYLLLCRIMLEHADDIDVVVTGKTAQKYAIGAEVIAMKAIGRAYQHRSLREFEAALAAHPEQLGSDPMIHAHFQALYEQLLHKNLLQIVLPYSHVQIHHIAQTIGLPIDVVESKYGLWLDHCLPWLGWPL